MKEQSIHWRHGLTETSKFNKSKYTALHLGQKNPVQKDRLGTNWLESFAERGLLLQQTEHESAAHPCREEG